MSQSSSNNITQLRQQLTAMTPELKNALPSNVSPEKFQRVVLTVANMTPDLLTGDRRSLLAACMKCAADGLVPDGREAALVMLTRKPQYMPMVAGLLKRARNSGEISTISAHVIHEADEFLVELGDDEKIVHKPAWNADRGKMVGVYAVAKLKDGGIQRALLSAAEVEKVKSASRSGNNGPWGSWPEEMWKKTAIRRLTKYLPMDAENEGFRKILDRDDEDEARTIDAKVVPIDAQRAPSKLDALEDMSGDPAVDVSDEPPGPSLIEQIKACTNFQDYQQTLEPAAQAQLDAGMDVDESVALEDAMEAATKRFQHPTVAAKGSR